MKCCQLYQSVDTRDGRWYYAISPGHLRRFLGTEVWDLHLSQGWVEAGLLEQGEQRGAVELSSLTRLANGVYSKEGS